MCGIAGFIGEDQERIKRMTAALKHRGPDGTATLVTHGASLGHARLAILDPTPEGNQPMWNASRTIAIVYNGEIFNYRELKEQYELDCRTGTDTEVLLKLFEREGMDFVPKLRGMFAFGIYDTRKQTWYLARDPSGIKPLFVAYPQGKLHFASEMRALMSALPAKPALDLESLSHYLRLQYVPGPRTLCQGISSLPPGTVLTWSDHGEHRDIVMPDSQPVHYASKAVFREQFPTLMDRVVRDHLISDKPVGIFLSGGMDSSILLHHMANHTSEAVKTFTVKFEATKNEDEARFNRDAELARITARHYSTDHTEILLTADLCRDIYKDSAMAMDQPNADSVAMAQYVMAREAKKKVDVVLCGAGGDELFGGYPRYRIAGILYTLRHIPPSLRSGLGSLFKYPADVLGMQPGPALAERLLARPISEIQDIVKGDWFDAHTTTHLFQDRMNKLHLHKDPLREFMEFDRRTWLVDESLRLNDAMTMASGLECRVPFLDPLIIEASHGTQSNWHVGLKRTKALLKDTYRPILPSHLYTLPKASFYPPLAKWLRRECAPLAEEMLKNPHIHELFDQQKVRTIFEEHVHQKKYNLHTLSTLIQLSNWFETVYDAA